MSRRCLFAKIAHLENVVCDSTNHRLLVIFSWTNSERRLIDAYLSLSSHWSKPGWRIPFLAETYKRNPCLLPASRITEQVEERVQEEQ